jgi:hypothetical protein
LAASAGPPEGPRGPEGQRAVGGDTDSGASGGPTTRAVGRSLTGRKVRDALAPPWESGGHVRERRLQGQRAHLAGAGLVRVGVGRGP